MARVEPSQLNIRSTFAKERATLIAAKTGLTVTRVIEEALRAYQPPSRESPPPGGLVRKNGVLVKPSEGRRITLDEANTALEEDRSARPL